jgi:hypothetical protein
MTTFTIPDKTAVTSISPSDDLFPVWRGGVQHTATAAQIVGSVPMVSPMQPNGATLTVKTSGGDFSDITSAIAYAEQTYVSPQSGNGNIGAPAFVNIVIDDGVWTLPNSLSGGRNCYLRIKGANAYAKTMSSVVSSSGSAGAWSLVLALSDVTSVAAGDYVLTTAPSGGSKPTYIAGCWPVTAVDTGNSRITVTTTHKAASAPSGAVAATVRVIKTVLSVSGSGADCVRAWDQSFLVLADVVLKGANGASAGLSVQDGSRVYLGPVGITGFNLGIYALYCSEINSDHPLCLSGNTNGAYIDANSCLYGASIVATGNGNGLYAFHNSVVGAHGGILSGNTTGAVTETMACADISSGFITGNHLGCDANKCSYIYDGSVTYSDNSTNYNSRFVVDGLLTTTTLIAGDARYTPSSSMSPWWPGQLVLEATNNTTLTFKLMGHDGVTRSGTLTLT